MRAPRLRQRLRQLAVLGLASVVAVGGLSVADIAPAHADTFAPGNIISDQTFYNPSTMDAAAIQGFLNGQFSGCSAGYTCVRDYTQATPSKPAESGLCNAYAGSASESAAQIIAKVSVACGVNPQVLLVLLQKESSLLTNTRPSYNTVTGFGCPDTAACNTSYYGFFNQVYLAARQFRLYRLYPNNYGYVAGRVNFILYNPNQACGGSNVYISNQATAGLYNYTPYQPNAAALANLRGTGDSCSSYGNRNFWVFFNSWFGSTAVSSGKPLLGVRQDGTVGVYPNRVAAGDATPFGLGPQVASGWGDLSLMASGDVDCNGSDDVIGVSSSGTLMLMRGVDDASGTVTYPNQTAQGDGWSVFRKLMLADVDGDCRADILGVTADGALKFYRNILDQPSRPSTFGYSGDLGSGWSAFGNLAAGDIDGDGRADIVAWLPDGSMWSYRNSITTTGAARPYTYRDYRGDGWSAYSQQMLKDVTGDGYSDILAVDPSGGMYMYPNTRSAPPYLANRRSVGTGWNGLRYIL